MPAASRPREVPYWWPVDIVVPGLASAPSFDVAFRYRTLTDIEAFIARATAAGQSDEQIAIEAIEAWRGVEAGGQPVSCTPESVARLAGVPAAARAIVVAFCAYAIAQDPIRARKFDRLRKRFARQWLQRVSDQRTKR